MQVRVFEMTTELVRFLPCFASDFPTARKISYECNNLIELLFAEGNPSGIKCAMALAELDTGVLRLPLVSVSENTRQAIKCNMNLFNILHGRETVTEI